MSILLAVQIRLEVTNTELWLAEPGNQSSQPQIMATPWPAAHTDTSPAYLDWWKDIRFRPRYLMIWMKPASAGISDQDESQVMKHNSLCMRVNPTVLHSHLYPSRRSAHKRRHIISTVESATCLNCIEHSAPNSAPGEVITFIATDIFPGCFHNKLLAVDDLIKHGPLN